MNLSHATLVSRSTSSTNGATSCPHARNFTSPTQVQLSALFPVSLTLQALLAYALLE